MSISDWSKDLAKHLGGNSEQSEDSDGQNERCVRFSSIFYAIDPQNAFSQMSSVASKHALFIALGGFSIAALFVWYISNKDKDERKKKKVNDLVTNGGSRASENGTAKKVQNGHANGGVQSSSKQVEQKKSEEQTADVPVQNEKASIEKQRHQSPSSVAEKRQSEVEETDHHVAAGDSRTVIEQKKGKEEEQKENEPHYKVEDSLKEQAKKAEIVEEEQFVKKEEPKLKSAPAAPITMPSKSKVLEHEQLFQIPEEPTPTKSFDACSPLSLDVTAQMSPAAFSWSEEMEKSCTEDEFRMNESSDIDRSPASPLRHLPNKRGAGGAQRNSNANRKGGRANAGKDHHHNHKEEKHAPIKKGQRRLTKEKSVEETPEKPQKRVVVKHQEAEPSDVSLNQTIEIQHPEDESYEKSGSPGLDSQNSEASSQDSGRATGPLASPHDEGLIGADDDFLPMYEFEIPNSLVGLIIGVKGKTIKELSQRTNVRMLIRQHHAPEKSKSHQICQVRGKRDEINHCLQMLRRRFPPARFPELNLQPVVPPVLPNSNFDMLSTQPTWLTLPEEIKCEVAVSSIISASHFFIQQPTHPSFASLRHLDMYMGTLYGEQSNLPELPIPCQNGLLCAAPVANSWFRAVTVQYFDETDEVFVKFVDYGGYSKMARQDLRQIRTDLMSLPFQSTEVMLAHVRPVDGTNNWSDAAMQKFRETCIGKVINCKMVGYSADTRIPMVELYMTVKEGEETNELRFDQLLMDCGLARTADPSKMSRVAYTAPTTTNTSINVNDSLIKRPSFSSQTSQTAVVC